MPGSAHGTGGASPGETGSVIDGSAPPNPLAAAVTAALAAVAPRIAGRDVRARHYWDAVTRAYARGRKRATSVVTAS